MTDTTLTGANVLDRMDEAKLSRLHWKIMFISGMGFFTDAYDLFIIGVVMALLKQQWSITPTEESYFFTEFGPNSTTFVYPAEIFPVRARTTGHGIAAAAGKLGGFFGVFLFPILMAWNGLFAAEAAAATVSILGAVVTLTMLPETKGRSLEELNPEETAAASA
jgi:hypothetical protein